MSEGSVMQGVAAAQGAVHLKMFINGQWRAGAAERDVFDPYRGDRPACVPESSLQDPEARCVAVPVRDFTGRVAGAIGMSGPMWRLSLQALQEKSKYVREAAVGLSAELGYQAEREPAASVA